MGPELLVKLSDRERAELEALLDRTKDARTQRRCRCILRIAGGEPPELVADALDVGLASVYRWIQRFNRRKRAVDLLEKPRSGRPSKLFDVSDEEFDTLLEQSPQNFGYRATTWTVALLGRHVQRQFGISVSDETLRRRLHRQNYRSKRPRYVYRDPDPLKGQKKGASFER